MFERRNPAGRASRVRLAGLVAGWMEVAPSSSNRLKAMEGIRGLAVAMVFFVHYVALAGEWMPVGSATEQWGRALALLGNRGVDLFFILSGFLIYGSLVRKHQKYLPFLRRRIERIYPTFLIVLAVYLLLSLFLPAESKLPPDFGAGVRLVIANVLLLPGITDIPAIITVAWSLSYEFFFYLTTPFIVAALRMRRWNADTRSALLLLTITGLVVLDSLVALRHLRLVYFLAGAVLFELVENKLAFSAQSLVADALALLLLFVTLALIGTGLLAGSQALGTTLVAFTWFTGRALQGRGLAASAFSFTPLRWLGNMSYSYYLIHGLTLKAIGLFLSPYLSGVGASPALFWGLLVPSFCATLVTSMLLFVLVERRWSIRGPHLPNALRQPDTT